MPTKRVELAAIDAFPEFGLPKMEPVILAAEYQQRIEAARSRLASSRLDTLVVYGDREHFANMAFLTAHDPRFEEAMLILHNRGGKPILVLGNEGMGHSELIPIDVERKLYQGFSLLGQKRDVSPRLEPVLRDCGIREGSRVGVAGWKYASSQESDHPENWLDAPAFIVDALRELVGDNRLITNATALFMNPVDGLRIFNSVDQLAVFEFAASHCSQRVRNSIAGLRPGLSEYEMVEEMRLNGFPLSAHAMFSSGPRSHLGLVSPTDRVVQRGDPFFSAIGLRGSLTARGGFVIASQGDLPPGSEDYLDALVKPYFAAVVAWYEQIGIGVKGGALQKTVEDALAGCDVGISLNPGHLIHLEEWVHSPIFPESQIPMQSGMLVQVDIIPTNVPRLHTTNLEDTIALADLPLREKIASRYPEIWQRIEARRAFMQDVLGIHLKSEILPFSNLPAILQPFGLSPRMIMRSTG